MREWKDFEGRNGRNKCNYILQKKYKIEKLPKKDHKNKAINQQHTKFSFIIFLCYDSIIKILSTSYTLASCVYWMSSEV